MASFDAHKNFAYSTVATAPSPATSGTSLVVASGDGTKFPTPPFNAMVWPVAVQPTTANAEIVRVTGISTDTLTITRAQESTSARTVVIGDQIAAGITAKTLTDVEGYVNGTTAPTFLTPALGTPASGVMTNVTGLPNAGLSTSAGEIGGAWATWTPTRTNLTIGNGTEISKYYKIGKTIIWRYDLVFGSTTSVSGDIKLTLPVTAAAYGGAGVVNIGMANLFDSGGGRVYYGTVNMFSTTVATVRPSAADQTYGYTVTTTSSTIPFTWATSAEIGFTATFEAA